MSKKLLAALVASAGFAMAAPASAVVVGGVDFGAGATGHFETTTLAETLVLNDGDVLSGYGQINTVNGNLFYAGTDRLYFTFTGYVADFLSPTEVNFTGGTVNVYLGATFNLLDQSSATNIATIQGYTSWLSLAGHTIDGSATTLSADGTLTGATISFTGQGLLDVVGGLADVVALLDGNSISDTAGGFADIVMTSSGDNDVSRLNRFDNTTGCLDGTAVAGQYCIGGSADLSGTFTTVPEPGVLALLGLGVFGIGASLRKRKAA